MRKIPPYGKPLHELITKGLRPTNSINLFIGTKSWEKGKDFSISYPERILILPAWISPIDYYWPVNDCDILIIDTGYANPDYVESLASSLYEHGADIVRFINTDFNLTVYHKEM